MYRFSILAKKINSHGGTLRGSWGVNYLTGSPNSNPYFWAGDLPELDKWYLVVGYIHGSNDPSQRVSEVFTMEQLDRKF